MAIIEKLPPFENVAASSTAVLPRLKMGSTYHRIIFELGGTTFTKAHITAIRLLLGGKMIWNITGSDLDAINKYYNQSAAATLLILDFADPAAMTPAGRLVGALDTSLGQNSFSIEVDIGAATAPTLEGYAVIGPPKAAPSSGQQDVRGVFRAMLKSTHSPAAGGQFSLPIPLGSVQGTAIRGIHFFHTNITDVEVTKDGLFLQQEGDNSIVQGLQNQINRTTQSGLLSYDPMIDNLQADAVVTARGNGSPANMEFKVTTSASDTIRAYSDLYSDLQGL